MFFFFFSILLLIFAVMSDLLNKEVIMNLDYQRFTKDLDDKYGWNDPFLTARTLSQPESVTSSQKKEHRKGSTSPVLHGK